MGSAEPFQVFVRYCFLSWLQIATFKPSIYFCIVPSDIVCDYKVLQFLVKAHLDYMNISFLLLLLERIKCNLRKTAHLLVVFWWEEFVIRVVLVFSTILLFLVIMNKMNKNKANFCIRRYKKIDIQSEFV